MRAVDENAFDSGLGVGESQQLNNLNNELGIGIGGGSGVGISYGGGGGGGSSAGFIPIVDTPNVANTDNKNVLYIKSNKEASIYVNDLPLYQTTSYGLSVSLSDLLTNADHYYKVLHKAGFYKRSNENDNLFNQDNKLTYYIKLKTLNANGD